MATQTTDRTAFLREQAVTGANKVRRAALPADWSTVDVDASLPERRALGLKMILDRMPLFIGDEEWIVGTRTLLAPLPGNEDGHDRFRFGTAAGVPYVTQAEIDRLGVDHSFLNKTHYTPDFGIVLTEGVDGILARARTGLEREDLAAEGRDFLRAVVVAYEGLKSLALRYAAHAEVLAGSERDARRRAELRTIAAVCAHVSGRPAGDFHQALQLLWFAQLAAMAESFEFINYGRLDVVLGPHLGDMDRARARQLVECLLLKMYDQFDLDQGYLAKYAAQLNVTLGGILPDGSDAVNEVTFLFLGAVGRIALPEPMFSLRIHTSNPPAFLEEACALSVRGINSLAYYHDDLFVDSLAAAGVPLETARDYSFDLCQDITFAGKGDLYMSGGVSLAHGLLDLLHERTDFPRFEDLVEACKERIARIVDENIAEFDAIHAAYLAYARGDRDSFYERVRSGEIPADWWGRSVLSPLPFLSGLYHGPVENALDMTFESFPVKDKGFMVNYATEAVNSLAAIRKVVFDDRSNTLAEVVAACDADFAGDEGETLRTRLWNAPKWGNDDEYVDAVAKDVIEHACRAVLRHRTVSGGRHLAGIHQPHPVPSGENLPATPEGRHAGRPTAVTLTPESGTMRRGPTAALRSAAKLDPRLIQWNQCVMVNYFAQVFRGNDGARIFKDLLKGYFALGGMQHQPNILDVEELRRAQDDPTAHGDLIVRLWGVSARFIDLPRDLQDEVIARFDAS